MLNCWSFRNQPRCLTTLFIVTALIEMQELLVIDDLLSALVGIEGRYISIKRVRGKEGYVVFQIDSSMDLALQVSCDHAKKGRIYLSLANLSLAGVDSPNFPLM